MRFGDAVFHPQGDVKLPPCRSQSTRAELALRRLGRSSGSRIHLLAASSHPQRTVTCARRSSPVTAAGPRRIRTVFPKAPKGATQRSKSYPKAWPLVKRNDGPGAQGSWKKRKGPFLDLEQRNISFREDRVTSQRWGETCRQMTILISKTRLRRLLPASH